MNQIDRFMPLAGRILLAAIFIISGFGKITGFEGTAGFMASYGMPMASVLLVGAIVLELGGGLSVLLGYKAKWGALALIVFTIPATLVFHAFWSVDESQQMVQQIMFMKNLAIMGGLFYVMAYGSGAFSLDNRRSS